MAEYAGMTVHERLAPSGMNFCFEEATWERDRNTMVEILVALEMNVADASKIVDANFIDPVTDGL